MLEIITVHLHAIMDLLKEHSISNLCNWNYVFEIYFKSVIFLHFDSIFHPLFGVSPSISNGSIYYIIISLRLLKLNIVLLGLVLS